MALVLLALMAPMPLLANEKTPTEKVVDAAANAATQIAATAVAVVAKGCDWYLDAVAFLQKATLGAPIH